MSRRAAVAVLALLLAAACAHQGPEKTVETRTHQRTITVEPGPAAEIK